MTIAREEIFGPVLAIIGYEDEADAVHIANDTLYGLSGYVQSANLERARKVARQIRAGNVHVNGAAGGGQVLRSGAISNPATAVSSASGGLRSFLKPRQSWDTTPRNQNNANSAPATPTFRILLGS